MADQARPSFLTIMVIFSLSMGAYFAFNVFKGDPQPTPPPPPAAAAEDAAPGEGPNAGHAPRAARATDRDNATATAANANTEASAEPAGRTVAPGERDAAQQLVSVETDHFIAHLTNLNTGVTSMLLTHERYLTEEGEPSEVVTTDREPYLPFRLTVEGMPAEAVWEAEQVAPDQVRFSWQGDGLRVIRKVEAGQGPYQLWSTVRIVNRSSRERTVRVRMGTAHYVPRELEKGGGLLSFARRSPAISFGICLWGDDEVTRVDRKDGLPDGDLEDQSNGPGVLFAGTENTYFANVMAVDGAPAERCEIHSSDRGGTRDEPHGSLFETSLIYPEVTLGPGESTLVRTLAYLGPKAHDPLYAAGHHLPQVVNLGWFSMVAEHLVALLTLMFGLLGNWGLAIIVMTVLVRIVMLPLTWKSFQSMGRMRVLKPEMDRINALYKDDREKKGAATMELFRKHKVNPLGGCLPQLLQMPVWIAFYASLSTNVELYRADFALWWTDLSAPDPYFVLPIAIGGLMFFQQKITPAAMDPMQAKIMMYFMPLMITSFMLFLPAGLCLYMVTNSILGITQQQYIHRSLNAQAAATAEAEAAETVAASDEATEPEDTPGSVLSRTKPKKNKPKRGSRRRTRRARS